MTAAQDIHDEIVRFLSQASTYGSSSRVECIQTHISCVFLTEQHAYKLKKPVQFDFVDFSTPALRRAACEEEVRLNRRLSQEVYHGVAPITREADGRLKLNGDGEPIDWVVKMRRLDESRMMDQVIGRGELSEADLQHLADLLIPFYSDAPPLEIPPEQYRHELEQHVRGNRRELLSGSHQLASAHVRGVHAAQLLFLHLHPELLEERVVSGHIIDGHGDLRPEHICLEQPVSIFDCLEFSAEFRRLDVLDELSFLAMECDFLQASRAGERILESYIRRCGDHADPRLLAFYKSYRACVRGKVAALRSEQLEGVEHSRAIETAQRYITLTERYTRELSGPLMLIVRGTMGTGKTTLACLLEDRLGFSRLSTDDIRRQEIGPSAAPAGYEQGTYSREAKERVYSELLTQASCRLAKNEFVVLDGTFLKAEHLSKAAQVAAHRGVKLLTITCHVPDAIARQRIQARSEKGQDTSEARPDLLAQQKSDFEQVPTDLAHLEIDTTKTQEEQLQAILERIKGL